MNEEKMAKTNYNKAEEIVDKELQKFKVNALLHEADLAQNQEGKLPQEAKTHTPKQIMLLANHDLRAIYKHDRTVYKNLKLKRKRIDELLKLVSEEEKGITEQDLKEIEQLKEKVEQYKKNKFEKKTDEELLATQIGRHIYKRHNTHEEWIPMDTHSDWDKYKKKPKKQ